MAEKSWVLYTGMRCHIWRKSVDFVDIRSRYLFSKTSIYCKIKTIAFLFAFFVLFCFVYRTPGIILTMNKDFNYSDTTWAPWLSEQRQLPIKGQNSALLTQGGTPVISGFPSKGAINAENVSMLCGWKSLKSGMHIKYHQYRNLCWIA